MILNDIKTSLESVFNEYFGKRDGRSFTFVENNADLGKIHEYYWSMFLPDSEAVHGFDRQVKMAAEIIVHKAALIVRDGGPEFLAYRPDIPSDSAVVLDTNIPIMVRLSYDNGQVTDPDGNQVPVRPPGHTLHVEMYVNVKPCVIDEPPIDDLPDDEQASADGYQWLADREAEDQKSNDRG